MALLAMRLRRGRLGELRLAGEVRLARALPGQAEFGGLREGDWGGRASLLACSGLTRKEMVEALSGRRSAGAAAGN